MTVVIILAGGMGKRMKSDKPKVLVDFEGTPMLVRLLREVKKLNVEQILIVVGKHKEIIQNTLELYNLISSNVKFVNQSETLGTGHAVMCCHNELDKNNSDVLVLYGDTPLLKKELMADILAKSNDLVCMITKKDNPYGAGRIIQDNEGNIERIIEEKDCDDEEKLINIVNCGIYKFNSKHLCKNFKFLENNNKQNEYYLTDMIEIIAVNENIKASTYVVEKENQYQVIGVNTREELSELEQMVTLV